MIYKSDGNNTINISAEDIQNLLNSSVRYTAQTLTTNQQEQVRKNIGATAVIMKTWTVADIDLA